MHPRERYRGQYQSVPSRTPAQVSFSRTGLHNGKERSTVFRYNEQEKHMPYYRCGGNLPDLPVTVSASGGIGVLGGTDRSRLNTQPLPPYFLRFRQCDLNSSCTEHWLSASKFIYHTYHMCNILLADFYTHCNSVFKSTASIIMMGRAKLTNFVPENG